MRNFLAYSLKRLGADYIDIYRPARLDPGVPIEDTVGALDLQRRPEILSRLEAIVPPDAAAGQRYNAAQMAHLDSEMG